MTTAPTPQPEALRLAALLTTARSFDHARIGTDARFVEIRSAQALEIAQELTHLHTENERLRSKVGRFQGVPIALIEAVNKATGSNDWQGDHSPAELLEPACRAIAELVERKNACIHKLEMDALDLAGENSILKRQEAEKLEARKPLPPTDMTITQHVNAIVGDGLTAQKVEAICAREPYDVTGVVLSLPDGRACIVNQSAVRWFHGAGDFWNLMHVGAS